jgi:predicted dehydrogenase
MSAQVPRIVVIGTGKLAKIHLAYLASIFPIYAIVDSTLSRSKSSEFQAANYWTYEEYLQRVDFDIVVIVSRDSYHFDHAKHGTDFILI